MGCFISVLVPFTNGLQVSQFWGAYEEPIGVDELCGFDFVDSNAPIWVLLFAAAPTPPPTPAAKATIKMIKIPSTITKVLLFIPHIFPPDGSSPLFRSGSF